MADKETVVGNVGSTLVRLTEYKGKRYVDIRQHFEKDGKHIPTKKGICMPETAVSDIINLMEQAEASLKGEKRDVKAEETV